MHCCEPLTAGCSVPTACPWPQTPTTRRVLRVQLLLLLLPLRRRPRHSRCHTLCGSRHRQQQHNEPPHVSAPPGPPKRPSGHCYAPPQKTLQPGPRKFSGKSTLTHCVKCIEEETSVASNEKGSVVVGRSRGGHTGFRVVVRRYVPCFPRSTHPAAGGGPGHPPTAPRTLGLAFNLVAVFVSPSCRSAGHMLVVSIAMQYVSSATNTKVKALVQEVRRRCAPGVPCRCLCHRCHVGRLRRTTRKAPTPSLPHAGPTT